MEWVNRQLQHEFPFEMLAIRNAVAESLVLHRRILIELLISKDNGPDDITLQTLMPDWIKTPKAKQLVSDLQQAYGDSKTPDTPCWVFNKLIAHATLERSNFHDYSSVLNVVEPPVNYLLIEIKKHVNRDVLNHYLGTPPSLPPTNEE
jgi:hypothetical protein